jgi:hypothetical protein
MKQYIDKLPFEVVFNHIIPYTYSPQPKILLEDIRNYVYTFNLISSIYYNRWIVFWGEEENEDKFWLCNDIYRFVDDLKFKAREKSYSIFDQKYYTNVSKGIVADDVQLMTKDNFILAEYANRLNHINNSMKNVLLPSIDRHYKRAVELLSILKKEYKLKEDSVIVVSNF